MSRSEFFENFVKLIEKDPRFSLVCTVAEARVPIIKCVLDGVHFDLLYANVDRPSELLNKRLKDG